jgi:hypothetical protein
LKKRTDIDQRLDAIDLLVGRGKGAGRTRRQTPTGAEAHAARNGKATPGSSLRGEIRKALSGIMVELKPADVIVRLKDNGFEVHGKTPYETRVYNELKRMMREGLLDRRDGRYALKSTERGT